MSSPANVSSQDVIRKISYVSGTGNLAGALIVFVYFMVIDPLPAGQMAVRGLGIGSFVGFVVAFAAATAVATISLASVVRSLERWGGHAETTDNAIEIPESIKKQALIYPLRTAMATLAAWTTASAVIVVMYFGGQPSSAILRVLAGTMGVGALFTTAIVYFSSEVIWRQALPSFFPDGRVNSIPAFRLPILGRLLIGFLLIGL